MSGPAKVPNWSIIARALEGTGVRLTPHGRTLAGPPKLRTECAWCDALIHPGTEPTDKISHGVCGDCAREIERNPDFMGKHAA